MPTERRTKAKPSHERLHSRERKPIITIIGAGRLGTALALALSERGYTIAAVMARTLAHARRAARITAKGTHNPASSEKTLALSASDLDSLPRTDLLFITTPDDHLASVAARLAASLRKRGGAAHARATALHCSGALSSEVLSTLRAAGLRVGSMHPLVSISDPAQGAESLRGAFYCIEGEPAAKRAARAVVRDLEGESFSVNRRDKALYHAAAVMASGHTVALFDIAAEMLTRCGLSPRRARAVLLPLVRSTLENLSRRDPARALTGTFARADAATATRHLDALRGLKARDALAIYKLLGRRSLALAEKAGADSEALKQIRRALEVCDES
jgi:predicted short-subunit dehydrogenase-like oxidoreductase (DUF2520 family)